MRTGLALTKIVLTLLAKSVLIPLGLTAATSAVVAAIKKNFFFWIWYDSSNDFKWKCR